MIVAATKCMICGTTIELDDKYGWTKEQQDIPCVRCDTCYQEEIEELRREQAEVCEGLREFENS